MGLDLRSSRGGKNFARDKDSAQHGGSEYQTFNWRRFSEVGKILKKQENVKKTMDMSIVLGKSMDMSIVLGKIQWTCPSFWPEKNNGHVHRFLEQNLVFVK
jgi:hypothetical protein